MLWSAPEGRGAEAGAGHVGQGCRGRRLVDRRVPGAHGLAGERQREPGVLAGRADPADGGQGRGQLLAEPRLPGGRGRGPPGGRPAHPRPRHAVRLLRGLVVAVVPGGGPQRGPGQGGRPPAAALRLGRGADRELPRDDAERVGGRAGVQLVRHVHGPVRAARRAVLRGGPAGDPGARLQPQRAVPVGDADAVHQPHVRLDVPGRPARGGAVRRGGALRLHLRRPAARDGPDQPRVHRGHDRRRRVGPGLHVPDPDVQHHARLRLAQRERRPPLRDDGPVRAAVLPELPQLRDEPRRRALDVLPPAAGPARAAQAGQRPVRVGRADRVARRGHRELRPARVPARRGRGRPARRRSTGCWTWRGRRSSSSGPSSRATSTRGCSRTPGATWARSTTTSRRSASTA